MLKANLSQTREQRKIEKLLAKLAQMKQDQRKPDPKDQALKQASAA
jgi:hypothetical protein